MGMPRFSIGGVVEYREPLIGMRVGIVSYINNLNYSLTVTELGTGVIRSVLGEDCKVIHGYLHIDRTEERAF